MSRKSDFDKMAIDYSFWEYTCRVRYKRILQYLPLQTKTALDLGCGSGALVELLSHYFKHVIGIDSSQAMIRLAKERVMSSHVGFIESDIFPFPFEENSFDFIVSYAVFHHFDFSDEQFFEKLRKSIRPKGRIIVCDFTTSDRQHHKLWFWHLKQVLKNIPIYMKNYGFLSTYRIVKFRLSKSWLNHVSRDPLMTKQEFEQSYRVHFPNCHFDYSSGLAIMAWEAQ